MGSVTAKDTKAFSKVALSTFILLLTFSLCGCELFSQQNTPDILDQQSDIRRMIQNADTKFQQLFEIEERTDEAGDPYLIGVLDSELDALLGNLIDAYNADPATTKPLTEEELRRALTEGVLEAAQEDPDNSAIHDFLVWSDTDADLVYRHRR